MASRREAEPKVEIAATRLARRGALGLVVAFVAFLLSGVVLELVAERGKGESLLSPSLWAANARALRQAVAEGDWRARNRRLGNLLSAGEERIRIDSNLASKFRAPLQKALVSALRYGNSQVLVGVDGRLFFSEDFEHVVGAGFLLSTARARPKSRTARRPTAIRDPAIAIARLARDLTARGVGFALLPVPTKLTVQPNRFSRSSLPSAGEFRNASTEGLLTRLRSEGIDVIDPLPALLELEQRGVSTFLRLDSHWSPVAFDRVAELAASHLRSHYDLGEVTEFRRHKFGFDRHGDLAALLGIGERWPGLVQERVELFEVRAADGRRLRTRAGVGPVILLGDSFSRLFISHAQRRGDANFAAQLAFHLRAPVAMFAENDAGENFAARCERLLRPGALDAQKVVVLEVAERAFTFGDWQPVPLAPP